MSEGLGLKFAPHAVADAAHDAARWAARTIALLATAQILLGCASAPTTTRDTLLPACRASEVLYCAANGSHAADGLCTCLTQSAAKATVDSL